MGLLDIFKGKKNKSDDTVEYLDDITFIKDMKHFVNGPWHQYDVLLDARGYGWKDMLMWADYLSEADISNISEVEIAGIGGAEATNITDLYNAKQKKFAEMEELVEEKGLLSMAGISKCIQAPMKIVWFNQTQILRFFTFVGDEMQMKQYIETVIRRTFGTPDAMKLGKTNNEKTAN